MKSLDEVVQDYQDRITQRIAAGQTSQKAADALGIIDSDLELFEYQNIQSQAFAAGIITQDQAFWLYVHLGGENPMKEDFNARPTAERIVITQLCGELLLLLHPELKSKV